MDDYPECRPGRRASATLEVGEADTALAMGSGEVPLVATPRVLGLAEHAAVQALGGCLPEDKTSVGAWAEIEHLLPARVGDTLTAEAVLLGVHGRRLEFSISITNDGEEEVAHCRHHRLLVSRSRYDEPQEASFPR